ncbi:DUF1893 domain-containing protein [Bacteroides sp.]|uniref:DUF1893 domain-containing protein n=1 Tax=Bacteroides sp. TaxID=29523 RepID=UPI0025C726AD|nr:DUF1893 domain-containing protein [Bacteroides sp.]
MKEMIKLLRTGRYSCVITNGDETRTFTKRGLADLHELLLNNSPFLNGASIADKVIGKAAAALLIMGRIKRLYAIVISEPALSLLLENKIEVKFFKRVPYIENRDKSGWCPMELAVHDKKLSEIGPIVDDFICQLKNADR